MGGCPASVVVPDDRAGLDKVQENLGDEEGIAVGFAVDGMGETNPDFVELVSGGALEVGEHPEVVEARELQSGDRRFAAELAEGLTHGMGARELRVSEGAEKQETTRSGVGDEVPEELDGRLVHPVQVVENHDDRDFLARFVQQTDGRAEQQIPLGVGIGRDRFWQVRQTLMQRRDEAHELTAIRLDVTAEGAFRSVCNVMPEQLAEGPIGDAQFLVAATEEHGRTLRVRSARGFGDQRRLSLSGLARDENRRSPHACFDTLHRVVQRGERVDATDHSDIRPMCETGRQGHLASLVRSLGSERRPDDFV